MSLQQDAADRYLDKAGHQCPTTEESFDAGWSAHVRELQRLARHWEQFGTDVDRERAATIRDALRLVREGWGCTNPDHEPESRS